MCAACSSYFVLDLLRKFQLLFSFRLQPKIWCGLLYSSMPTASPYHVTYLDFISTAISDIKRNLLSAFISRMWRLLQAGGICWVNSRRQMPSVGLSASVVGEGKRFLIVKQCVVWNVTKYLELARGLAWLKEICSFIIGTNRPLLVFCFDAPSILIFRISERQNVT
jgi:hypothetical protein